jgi:hypothetical protein
MLLSTTGGDEWVLVTLANREAVETQLFGEHCLVQDITQPVSRALLLTGDGIRNVGDKSYQQELHAQSPPPVHLDGTSTRTGFLATPFPNLAARPISRTAAALSYTHESIST